jgi:mercuric ion transport protein
MDSSRASLAKPARSAASFPRWLRRLFSCHRQLWRGHRTGLLEPVRGAIHYILLPMFAGIALLANAIAWLNHRQWRRTALGTIGPILVLAAVFLMRAYGWQSGGLLYVGLALMVGVSVWDFIRQHIAAAGRTAVNCQNNVADGNSRSHHRKGKYMTTLKITGMTCDSCAAHVKEAWRKCPACNRRWCPIRRAQRNSPLRRARHRMR